MNSNASEASSKGYIKSVVRDSEYTSKPHSFREKEVIKEIPSKHKLTKLKDISELIKSKIFYDTEPLADSAK